MKPSIKHRINTGIKEKIEIYWKHKTQGDSAAWALTIMALFSYFKIFQNSSTYLLWRDEFWNYAGIIQEKRLIGITFTQFAHQKDARIHDKWKDYFLSEVCTWAVESQFSKLKNLPKQSPEVF